MARMALLPCHLAPCPQQFVHFHSCRLLRPNEFSRFVTMAAKLTPSFCEITPSLSTFSWNRSAARLSLDARTSRVASVSSPSNLASLETYTARGRDSNEDILSELRREEPSQREPSVQKTFAWGETVDKNGRLRSPRAARELALCVLYAALVSDGKPMWIFQQRLKQTSGEFNKDLLKDYDHLPANGDSVFVDDVESARELEQQQEEEAALEAAVLTAPIALVYNKFVLNMAQNIIQSTADGWSQQEILLNDLLPEKWKVKGGGAMLQLCILHMAMAEMVNIGTSSGIVIDEAVELAKRFCDGGAARVINGCLGNFIRSQYFQESVLAKND